MRMRHIDRVAVTTPRHDAPYTLCSQVFFLLSVSVGGQGCVRDGAGVCGSYGEGARHLTFDNAHSPHTSYFDHPCRTSNNVRPCVPDRIACMPFACSLHVR